MQEELLNPDCNKAIGKILEESSISVALRPTRKPQPKCQPPPDAACTVPFWVASVMIRVALVAFPPLAAPRPLGMLGNWLQFLRCAACSNPKSLDCLAWSTVTLSPSFDMCSSIFIFLPHNKGTIPCSCFGGRVDVAVSDHCHHVGETWRASDLVQMTLHPWNFPWNDL